MTKKLLLSLCLLFFAVGTRAQQDQSATGPIVHISEFMGGAGSRSSSSDAARASQLIYDVHPSVYVSGSSINTYGNDPVVLHTDVTSLSSIASAVPVGNRANVEAVIIKIDSQNQLGQPIDLSVLSTYPRAKFVYILSTVNSSDNDVINAVSNNTSYSVFYNIEKAN